MINHYDFLEVFANSSAELMGMAKLLKEDKLTVEMLSEKLNEIMNTCTVKAIDASSVNASINGRSSVVSDYSDFYSSIVKLFVEGRNGIAFSADDAQRYIIAENVVSFVYLYCAYLIRTDKIADAEFTLKKKIRGSLESHYVPRAVYTLRSRAGVERDVPGWCIGIAQEQFQKSNSIQSRFFFNKDQLIDLLCQVDFLQYYLEFKVSDEVYHGFPNFLFFEQRRTQPIIEKIMARDGNRSEMEQLVKDLKEIKGGSFFTGNRWR